MNEAESRDLLTDLPVLVAFARTGSVTAAADELRLPQPSASRALARLTRRVGAQLTRRHGRGLVLTDAGRQLAGAATEAFAVLGDGLLAARRTEAAADAVISIAFQAVLGETYVPRAVARFRARHPGVRFSLAHGSRQHCIDKALADEVDIAIVADPPQPQGMGVAPLFVEPLVLVAPRQHPLALLDRPVRPAEIAAFEVIILAPGFGLHDSVRQLLSWESVPAQGTLQVDDSRVAKGLVAAGVGVTIMPSTPGPLDDALVELPIDHPHASRQVGALVAASAGEVVGDFIATLRTSAGYGRLAPPRAPG